MANCNWKPEGKRGPIDVVHIDEQLGQKGGWRREESIVTGYMAATRTMKTFGG